MSTNYATYNHNIRTPLVLIKFTIHILHFLALLFCAISLTAQNDLLATYEESTVERANSASNVAYLSDEEEKVITYLNLARMNGPDFVDNVLKPYLRSHNIKRNAYIRSLENELMNAVPLEPVLPREDLSKAAKEHVRYTGGTGRVGHGSGHGRTFQERLGHLAKSYSYVGENCDYGWHNALDIVIDLLIDAGVSDVGHRRSLLHAKYLYVGVSIGPHSKYVHTCVIEMGGEEL